MTQGIRRAPNEVTLMGYDPTTDGYYPIEVGPVQYKINPDGSQGEAYALLQINQTGSSGGGVSDITLHDFNNTSYHLAINSDGSINTKLSSSPTTTAINDNTTPANHLTIDSNGQIGINNFPASFVISGNVGVTSLPALPVGGNLIGHVVVDSAGSVSVISLPSIPSGSNVIGHVIVDSFGAAVAISTLPALPAGSNNIGHVTIDNFPATQPISGSVSVSNFPVTQPVSGSVNIGTLPSVNIAAAAGVISTTNTNGTTIGANTDYAITFSSQVSHFAIENNTSAVIQWELDATTSAATSLHLTNVSPGNLLLMDVHVTTIHVLSTVATAFNTASGICVRGWA